MPEPITVTIVSVTAVTVAVYVYKSIDRIVSAPKELIKQGEESTENVLKTFSRELRKVFGAEPRISIHRTVVQRGGEAIRELALYKETVEIIEEWENTSWRSTKRVTVKQPFTLKAGFDLNRIKFDLDSQTRKVTAVISDATVVNVEYAGGYEICKEEHGFWNRITAANRNTIINSLPEKAKQEAVKLQLREKAAAQLKLFLERVVPSQFQLEVRCIEDAVDFTTGDTLPSIPATTLSALGFVEESVETK